jgi:rhodanese-related sulfurtransferase
MKNMKYATIVFFAVATLAACKGKETTTNNTAQPDTPVISGTSAPMPPPALPDSSFLYLDVAGFERILESKRNNIAILDLRSPEEFKKGHLYKAINVPYSENADFKAFLDKLGSTQPVALYCNNGFNSEKTGILLRSMGHSNIYVLKGGIVEWLFADKVLVTF